MADRAVIIAGWRCKKTIYVRSIIRHVVVVAVGTGYNNSMPGGENRYKVFFDRWHAASIARNYRRSRPVSNGREDINTR